MSGAFYNENDTAAAAWLSELERRGHVAPGRIETRSIRELRAADVLGTTQAHFFAGIGGWSYALRLAGWPDSLPVWTGSCPCQPFSHAGRRRGAADERHLWPDFARLIGECRPPVVFGEQVASPDGRAWLAAVRSDLEAMGYRVGATDLCAAGIGAPHGRHRLYFVAHALGGRRTPRIGNILGRQPDAAGSGAAGSVADDADPDRGSRECGTKAGAGQDGERGRRFAGGGEAGRLADHNTPGRDWLTPTWLHDPRQPGDDADGRGAAGERGDTAGRGRGERGGEGGPGHKRHADGSSQAVPVDNTERAGLEGLAGHGNGGHQPGRHASIENGPAPATGAWGDCEWVYCRPDNAHPEGCWRPIEPGSFPLAHGIPARLVRLRGYGNAIIPWLAAEFIKACCEALELTAQKETEGTG